MIYLAWIIGLTAAGLFVTRHARSDETQDHQE